jgi:hypothetical protein
VWSSSDHTWDPRSEWQACDHPRIIPEIPDLYDRRVIILGGQTELGSYLGMPGHNLAYLKIRIELLERVEKPYTCSSSHS